MKHEIKILGQKEEKECNITKISNEQKKRTTNNTSAMKAYLLVYTEGER